MIFVNDSGCNVPTAELMQTLALILLAWVVMTLWLWFTLTNLSWDIEKEKSFDLTVAVPIKAADTIEKLCFKASNYRIKEV